MYVVNLWITFLSSIANMSIYEGELVEALQKSGSDPEWDSFHS